jgi:twitching motility protein PilT
MIRSKLQTNRAGAMQLLQELVHANGTDLHLKVPGRPMFRIDDQLVATHHDRLLPEDLQQLAHAFCELARDELGLASVRDRRLAFGVEGIGRFRAQIVRQRGSLTVVVHRIATEAPRLSEVAAPQVLADCISEGPTGAGGLILVGGNRRRLHAISALVRHYNEHVSGHLVSIEDPVVCIHRDARAALTQREVGLDVDSFRDGLISARGLDADAIVVTDVMNADDAELVLRAAEEGLLVVAGLATSEGAHPADTFRTRFDTACADAGGRARAVMRHAYVVTRAGRLEGLDGR